MIKNIGVVYQGPYPPMKGWSGGDRRVKDLTIALSYYSNNTTLFVPAWHNSANFNSNSDFFKIRYLSSFFNKLFFINRIIFWSQITYILIKHRYSFVLLYMSTFECIPFLIILRLFNIKIIFEISDLNSTTSSGLKKLKHKITESILPKLSDLNIGISQEIKKSLLTYAPNTNTIIIPILADTDIFTFDNNSRSTFRSKYSIQKDDVTFMYAGTFWKEEGVANLLYAFEMTYKKYSNVKLLIAGQNVKNDHRFDDIDEIIQNLESKNNIILLGWVETNELNEAYSAADVLTAPQTKSVFNVAALPTKLAEYCLMKKTIMVTNIGDVNLYFKNNYNSILIEDTTIDNISNLMNEVVEKKYDLQLLGENAYQMALKKFNRKKSGEYIIQNI